MKYENLKMLLFFGILTSLVVSCSKQLNVYPTTSEVSGNVIVDSTSAATILNGVYYRFANSGTDVNSVPTILWTDVNEILPSELAGNLTNSSVDDGVYSFTLTPTNGHAGTVWSYGYALVNAANGFFENMAPVKNIPAVTKTEMQAEAKFLRAFANEELLLYYGQYYDTTSSYGIILRDAFVTADNINLPRSSVAAAYTSILSDLDTAISGLPSLNTQIYYANSWVAKLLKARVFINRGAAGDYAQVISLTNDIISNGPFMLENNLQDVFWTNGFNSNEVMLGLQPYSTETYKFMQNQYYNQYPVSDSLTSRLTNDARGAWIYQPVDYGGTIVSQLTKYYSGSVTTISKTPLSETCYAFRLTEAYLLEAEALALSNGDLAKAKTLLTTVMSHAGNSDFTAVNNAATAADLQVLIVTEEMKNFVAENGADWFALRRLPFATMKSLQPNITTVDELILPIPNSEITANSKAIQNPGY